MGEVADSEPQLIMLKEEALSECEDDVESGMDDISFDFDDEILEEASQLSGDDGSIGPGPAKSGPRRNLLLPPIYQRHPLEDLDAMSSVFSHCSVEDLKNCRVVGSKVWLEASLPFWRAKASLKIEFGSEEEGSNSGGGGLPIDEFKDRYENDIDQFRRKPFRKLTLAGNLNSIQMQPTFPRGVFQDYLRHVDHLTFSNCKVSTFTDFMDILYQCPNLLELTLTTPESIKFTRVQYYYDSSIHIHPNPLKLKGLTLLCRVTTIRDFDFLLKFPVQLLFQNLPDLGHVRIKTGSDMKELRRILDSVRSIRRRDVSRLKLKNLEILYDHPDEAPPDKDFQNTARAVPPDNLMPLEQFTGAVVDLATLETYSRTLKSLQVFLTLRYQDPLFGEGPRMPIDNIGDISEEQVLFPHLHSLHVRGTPSRVFKNLNKLYTPKLETLIVEGISRSTEANFWKSFAMVPLNNASFEKVTKFEIYAEPSLPPKDRFTFGVEEMTGVCRSMPNVVHAKVPVTGKAFTELCKGWRKLQGLDILQGQVKEGEEDYGVVGDEAITGIPNGKDPTTEANRCPNISDLKDLEHFSNPHEFKLTGRSVSFGFLHLPRLNYLSAGFKQLSKGAKAALQKKVNALEIHEESVLRDEKKAGLPREEFRQRWEEWRKSGRT